jgi:hypothetical protein
MDHPRRRGGRRKKSTSVRLYIHTPKLGNVNIEELFRKIYTRDAEIEKLNRTIKCKDKIIEQLKDKVKKAASRRRVTGLKLKKREK